MNLEVECNRCLVASYCSKRGSSPSFTKNGKVHLCVLIGGYGRKPVDPQILSEKSKIAYENNGPCLTIAEVPSIINDDVFRVVEKIFSPPITHPREKPNDVFLDLIYPMSSKRN